MNLLAAIVLSSLIQFRPPIDERPFLIRLFVSVSMAFEVGAKRENFLLPNDGAALFVFRTEY